ncbi:MAG: hypothetical protein ACREBJ_10300 [Nitrosotalea sp.]
MNEDFGNKDLICRNCRKIDAQCHNCGHKISERTKIELVNDEGVDVLCRVKVMEDDGKKTIYRDHICNKCSSSQGAKFFDYQKSKLIVI